MQGETQPRPPLIEKAAWHDSKLLADILSDSFLQDPVMNWIIPDTRLYRGFYRMLVNSLFVHHNHMYMERAGRGAALWLPPGTTFHVPAGLSQTWLTLRLIISQGPRVLRRLHDVQLHTARHHPHFPHYYLQSIGARREYQGQGIGSALLKAVLPRCDMQKMPAYLESSNEKNLPLYQRHGFEVFGEETLGEGGPRMWFMLRQPREQ